MAPCGLLQPTSSVSFERKVQFSASRDLCFIRSSYFRIPAETESQNDVWRIQPADFSVKLYSRRFGSEQKERTAGSRPAAARPEETRRREEKFLHRIVCVGPEQRNSLPGFVTRHRPPDALEAQLLFVKTGKFHSGPYRNPKPHDFRPLDEDLPEVITSYEKDPGNLKLKLKHLDTLRTSKSEAVVTSRGPTGRMNTFKQAEPKWDSQLLLPPLPWPPKSASYTVRTSGHRTSAWFRLSAAPVPETTQLCFTETPQKKRSVQRLPGPGGGETLSITEEKIICFMMNHDCLFVLKT